MLMFLMVVFGFADFCLTFASHKKTKTRSRKTRDRLNPTDINKKFGTQFFFHYLL